MSNERLPIDLPIASSRSEQPRRSGRGSISSQPGKTLSVVTPTRRRRLSLSLDSLSDRDLAVLRSVAAHRFLMTRHLEVMHFSGHATNDSGARTARRVLKRLNDQGVLTHLQRRIGGVRAGSAGFVWMVGPTGARVLRTPDSPRWRRYEPSLRLLHHYLAVADAHAALISADGQGFELTTVELEPASWCTFLGSAGERRLIRPDLRVITSIGAYEDHWFLEIDLGNSHPPTIVDRCREYLTYASTGDEQAAVGLFPRVLWVVEDHEREARLRAALTRARLDPKQFRICTVDELVEVIAGGAA